MEGLGERLRWPGGRVAIGKRQEGLWGVCGTGYACGKDSTNSLNYQLSFA